MKRILILPLLLALLLSQGSAYACLNDRDTLAEEIKGLPDVVQVVTGRFERNPPLYYQMRLARVAAELKTAPGRTPPIMTTLVSLATVWDVTKRRLHG